MLPADLTTGERVSFDATIRHFTSALGDLAVLRPQHVQERSPDPTTAAWRMWAVAYMLDERGAAARALMWISAAAEALGGPGGPGAPLAGAELHTALGSLHCQLGDAGRAIPYLETATLAWTTLLLVDDVTDQVALMFGALHDGERPPDDVLRRSWLVERPPLAMAEVLTNRVRIVGAHGNTAAAGAQAEQGRAWLERYYPAPAFFGVTQAHCLILMALVDVQWAALESDEAIATFEVADALVREDGEFGEAWLARAQRLQMAPRLVQAGRANDALDLLAGMDEWFVRHGRHDAAFRSRSAACFARWRLSGDPGIEADLRRLIGEWEAHLRREDPSYGSSTGFVAKAHLTPAHRLLLTLLADRGDVYGYARLLSALRQPAELSGLDLAFEDPNLFEVIRSYLEPGTCALFIEYGAECLTFATLDARGSSLAVGSDALLSAVIAFDRDWREAVQQALAGLESDAPGADAVWRELPHGIRDTLERATTILYSPDPLGDTDELALELLCPWAAIGRFPTPGVMLGALAPRPQAGERSRIASVVSAVLPESFERLDAAGDEASDVERVLGLLGLEASRIVADSADGLIDALASGAGLIHYIGHGVAHQLSEAAMIGEGELERDQIPFLTGDPICVLSCCELARMRFVPGGGSRGFAEGLLDRGAAAIVTYTQPLPDRYAMRLAREFYRAGAREPVGRAAQIARERAVERGVNEAIAASLVVIGDPRTTIGAGPPPARPHWSSLLLRAVALGGDRTEAVALLPDAGWREPVRAWISGSPPPWRDRLALCESVREDDLRGGWALRILAAEERVAELGWDGPDEALLEVVSERITAQRIANFLGEQLIWAALGARLTTPMRATLPYTHLTAGLANAADELGRWHAVPGALELREEALHALIELMQEAEPPAQDDGPDPLSQGIKPERRGKRFWRRRGVVPSHPTDPTEPNRMPTEEPAALFARADALRRQGDTKGARAALDTLMQGNDPDYAAAAALNLGVMLNEDGDPLGALVALGRAMGSSQPAVAARATYLTGHIMHVGGRHAEARGYYERAAASSDPVAAAEARKGLQALDNLAAQSR